MSNLPHYRRGDPEGGCFWMMVLGVVAATLSCGGGVTVAWALLH